MQNKIKDKVCAWRECENVFKPYRFNQKHCSKKCFYNDENEKKKQPKKRKRINRYSKKNASIQKRYSPLRIAFLKKPKNKHCVIKSEKCTRLATTVEHSRGRGDYYVDEWAEKNDIPLTLDQRFWKPACLKCNLELENNSELSKAHQLSKIHGGKKL